MGPPGSSTAVLDKPATSPLPQLQSLVTVPVSPETLCCQPGGAAAQQQQQQSQQQDAVLPASSSAAQQQQPPPPAVPAGAVGQRYLVYFMHRLLEFQLPELRALAGMVGVEPLHVEPLPEDAAAMCGEAWPMRYVLLPGDEAATFITQRSMLIKGMFEVWAEAGSLPQLLAALEAPEVRARTAAAAAPPHRPFRVRLSTVGFNWCGRDCPPLIRSLIDAAGLAGRRVDLVGSPADGVDVLWAVCINSDGESGLPPMPERWIFAREVAVGDRSLLASYALPQRAYIGPTSMDPELAFIMTNMAQVRRHSLVMDPYLGTGSILVAAAARGAYTLGGDIDHRVVMAGKRHPVTGARLDVFANYAQYGLQWPVGLVRMDVHRHPFRAGLTEVLDAMLGDPPYGVRAGGRKSRAKPDALIRDRPTHIPSTAPYSLTECLADLLELAAQLLVMGGRLVFWMPSSPDLYAPEELPQHPCMALVANSEQILTDRYGRRLVTMVKVKRYDADEAARFRESRRGFVMALERLSQLVYSPKEEKAAVAAAAAAAAAAGEDGGGRADRGKLMGQQQRDEEGVTRPGVPKWRSKNY